MNVQWLLRGSVILMIGAIAACSTLIASTPEADNANSSDSPTVTPTGETAATENVERIVALTSLTADLVQTLDAEKLVAIPGSPILRQDERFAGLEIVSEGRVEPDLEKIVALEPDLVVGAIGFHDKTLTRLQELGVETLAVDVHSWEALKAVTQNLAQRMGADPQPLLDRYEACLAQATDRAPSALVLVSRQPLLSPNKDSWAGDFLTQFNIQNVTAELQGESPFDGYVTLSEENVLTVEADLLLVVETGEAPLLEQLKGDAFWGELKATQNDAVHTFDYFGLINPGSIASIEATCTQLSQLIAENLVNMETE